MTLQNSRRTQRQREAGLRKGDLREAQILDAAERLLATTPFRDMTMDDIAQQAGLSRSALYFYFASKDAVLAALMERIHLVMSEPKELLQTRDAPLDATMREVLEATVRNWRAHTHALRTFHEIWLMSPESGEQWRQYMEEHVAFVTDLVERERAEGNAPPGPPSSRGIASAWFWMMDHEFYELFRRRHTPTEEIELVDTLTTLWVRCLGVGERAVAG